MPKATTLLDVILGEAASGSPAQRYADMKAIASTIANRSRFTGVSPDQVVANRREFNAYGKSLPPGVGNYRSLAQQAWDDVQANGPSHPGLFYATPKASGNLPNGLEPVHQTTGHIYYTDPKNRAIGTSVGYRQPRQQEAATQAIAGILAPQQQPATVNERMGLLNAYSPTEPEPQMAQNTLPTRTVKTTRYFEPEPAMSLDTLRQTQPQSPSALAAQYASYGAGKIAPQMAGLLSQDVAYQGLINGLNAQKTQLQAGIDPMEEAAPWKTPDGILAQTSPQPPSDIPQIDPQPTASVSGVGGLLSPQEQQMYEAQRAYLSQQPFNEKKKSFGPAAKKVAGALGGALLGGMIAGPVGGLLGGFVGPRVVQPGGLLGGKYPEAPKSQSRGDGKINDYGRSVMDRSQQFREAMSRGGIGLY